jgi:hypothetical protein
VVVKDALTSGLVGDCWRTETSGGRWARRRSPRRPVKALERTLALVEAV